MSFGRIQRGSRQSLFWRRWHEDQGPVVPLQWGFGLPGTNRFHARPSPVLVLAKARESSLRVAPCVFVSHQYTDLRIAVRVAELLKELWVNVWLDVDDPATQQAVRSGDRVKLASSIDWGLTNCTHLLAIITPRTKGSWWVPYEIGAARGLGSPQGPAGDSAGGPPFVWVCTPANYDFGNNGQADIDIFNGSAVTANVAAHFLNKDGTNLAGQPIPTTNPVVNYPGQTGNTTVPVASLNTLIIPYQSGSGPGTRLTNSAALATVRVISDQPVVVGMTLFNGPPQAVPCSLLPK